MGLPQRKFIASAGPYRRPTRTVWVGQIAVGGSYPIRVQSMITADTKNTQGVICEMEDLVGAGCEIVRLTVPTSADCKNIPHIRDEMKRRGIRVPLVADIHFTPTVALEAVEYVDKVRVNPGNFADKKLFKVFEFSDEQYNLEIERIREKFVPLVRKCKEYGRALRIGTNHGSLSDRIMNRYGDTPQGMVESALEFVRICEEENFHDIILSMKASNVQVMIEAYRLLVIRMEAENMHYPLHLGVTEAGEGEEGRTKSAVGIGSLLEEGLGDTIRVSLTEDAVFEIPVAYQLVSPYNALLTSQKTNEELLVYSKDIRTKENLSYRRHASPKLSCGPHIAGDSEVPRFFVGLGLNQLVADHKAIDAYIQSARQKDFPIEGLEFPEDHLALLDDAIQHGEKFKEDICLSLKTSNISLFGDVAPHLSKVSVQVNSIEDVIQWSKTLASAVLAVEWVLQTTDELELKNILEGIKSHFGSENLLLSVESDINWVAAYRKLAHCADELELKAAFNLRRCLKAGDYDALRASVEIGALLMDGIGDIVQLDGDVDLKERAELAYNILQACRLRISKTEYISCPSCGRTQFDLQSTTDKIRQKTGHLKGVKIAVMGCIVNGPGEMADADFGYVGTGTEKISLYVGKECVSRNIHESEAVDRLICLIKDHDQWIDAP